VSYSTASHWQIDPLVLVVRAGVPLRSGWMTALPARSDSVAGLIIDGGLF